MEQEVYRPVRESASPFRDFLLSSVRRQEAIFKSSLILNPVENIPFEDDISFASSFMHGLYNTDKVRSNEQKVGTVHQFSGRDQIAYDTRKIYSSWANALGAEDLTMRLLSGLHAHTTIFMAIAEPGQSVLLLPEIAGGHMATHNILKRLGLTVIDMAVDHENQCIDVSATKELIKKHNPDFLFSDRSEGLIFEVFNELLEDFKGVSIFDASQYLTGVLAGIYPNPFEMGFDLMLSTLHKNFPGPQKALVATSEKNEVWKKLLSGISAYVSNMHNYGTYTAGITLEREEWIRAYAPRVLQNAISLEDHLIEFGVNVIPRRRDLLPTPHLWIKSPGREEAFQFFKDLESCRFLTNYRKLPYGLGFGLRLGLNAATRTGLYPDHTRQLASLIAEIHQGKPSLALRHECRAFIEDIWSGRNS